MLILNRNLIDYKLLPVTLSQAHKGGWSIHEGIRVLETPAAIRNIL